MVFVAMATSFPRSTLSLSIVFILRKVKKSVMPPTYSYSGMQNDTSQHRTVDSDSVVLTGAVDTMRIQEVGLNEHIWECGSEHGAGFRMFCYMKSELRLFVTLEPRFAAVRPTIPMRHHQDALGVMKLTRRGNLSE